MTIGVACGENGRRVRHWHLCGRSLRVLKSWLGRFGAASGNADTAHVLSRIEHGDYVVHWIAAWLAANITSSKIGG